jgi:hypothetical protein
MLSSLKKILIFSFGICLLATPVFAANLGDAFKVDDTRVGGNPDDRLDNASNVAGYNINGVDEGGVTVESIIRVSINALLSLLGIIFVVLTVYGGVIWMNAGGNDKKVEEGRSIISQALVGLIVVLAAAAISYFVMNAFSSGSTDETMNAPEEVQE